MMTSTQSTHCHHTRLERYRTSADSTERTQSDCRGRLVVTRPCWLAIDGRELQGHRRTGGQSGHAPAPVAHGCSCPLLSRGAGEESSSLEMRTWRRAARCCGLLGSEPGLGSARCLQAAASVRGCLRGRKRSMTEGSSCRQQCSLRKAWCNHGRVSMTPLHVAWSR